MDEKLVVELDLELLAVDACMHCSCIVGFGHASYSTIYKNSFNDEIIIILLTGFDTGGTTGAGEGFDGGRTGFGVAADEPIVDPRSDILKLSPASD